MTNYDWGIHKTKDQLLLLEPNELWRIFLGTDDDNYAELIHSVLEELGEIPLKDGIFKI